jgi:RNA polymerase sigma-70 factor (ECF subfamily)
MPANYHIEMAEVNGQPALIAYTGDQVFSVLTIEVEDEHIRSIQIVANPEKLARL